MFLFSDANMRTKAHRGSAGVYACQAENEVGRSNPKDIAHIYVEEKPQVTLYFEPRQPVSEVADANVTLICSSNYNRNVLKNANVISGSNFVSVKWYLDGDLLKKVDRSPECLVPKNRTSAKCHVDPSKGLFLSEDTDVFVITPNRRTFFFPETENLIFFWLKIA